MKYLVILLILLHACTAPTTPQKKEGVPNIADTTAKTYVSALDGHQYNWKKATTNLLELPPIERGFKSFELRFWVVSGSFNPQSLYILSRTDNRYHIDRYSYYGLASGDKLTHIDSLKGSRILLSKSAFDSLLSPAELQAFWQQPSQSQMKKGDAYGCVDGYEVLIEMADTARYKFACYICPDLHVKDEPAFERVNMLDQRIKKFLERVPLKPLSLE